MAVTVSLRRMSAGSGYQYLLRSVAVGDGARVLSTPLTRYYSEVGTPPGRWLGSGVRAFGTGQLAAGMRVTEEQLALLIGMGRDPITGEPLGRAYPTYQRLADRIDARVAALDPEMTRGGLRGRDAQDRSRGDVGGRAPRSGGLRPHLQRPEVGVGAVGGLRRGHPGADRGRTSRGGRRRHRVLRAGGGRDEGRHLRQRRRRGPGPRRRSRRRGLRPLRLPRRGPTTPHPRGGVEQGADRDGRALAQPRRPAGVRFASRHCRRTTTPCWPTASAETSASSGSSANAAPTATRSGRSPASATSSIAEFSSRTREIELKKDELIAEYVARHGRMPSPKTIVELRAQATLATRPPKELRSLADLTAEWRRRASARLGVDATAWAATLAGGASALR